MTAEARLAFRAFFFFVWFVVGLVPWAAAAIAARGRGSLLALPLALAGAGAFGIMVPLLGLRDATGFFLSLPAALAGGAIATFAGHRLACGMERRSAASEEPVPPLTRPQSHRDERSS